MNHSAASRPGEHDSLWLATTPETNYPQLTDQQLNVDVAVVGGGIAGLTTAYLLKQRGKRVALIEAGRIVHGTTAYTTAKLTSQHDLIYDHLISSFGEEKARYYGIANQSAIKFVADFLSMHKIDADFRHASNYVYSTDEKQVRQLQSEAQAAQRLGLPAEFITETELPFAVAGAVRFDGQAYFHPRKYLLAMAEMIPGDGSYLLEQTKAMELKEGSPCQVVTDRGTVVAQDVVMATHYPFHDNAFYFARLAPFHSYLMAVRLDGPLPQGMYITIDEQNTLRPHHGSKGDVLLVGGQGHKTGQGGDIAARYQRIEAWARTHFPVKEVLYSWSTQDYEPSDRVPLIGQSSPTARHVYVATGFQGWGMTTGTVAGMLLSDLIMGQKNPWEQVFNPNRVELTGFAKLAKEQVNVAKELVAGYVASRESENIPIGEGRVIEGDQGKFAVYRHPDGTNHVLSPICTHMGCVVEWNNADKSWDCPCHGSRFTAEGKVFDGPALHDLKRQEDHITSPGPQR